MEIKKTSFSIYKDCYELTIGNQKMIVAADIGPRILFFGFNDGNNVLFVDEQQAIGNDDTGWKIFGGSRLWVAPETEHSYAPDNDPCQVEQHSDSISFIRLHPENRIEKKITIKEKNGRFQLRYQLDNKGGPLYPGAIWALTCIEPKGTVFFPWSGKGEWDVKKILYWKHWIGHGTKLRSSQYIEGDDLFMIKPTGEEGKVGTAGWEGFIGVSRDDCTFIKKFDRLPVNDYPDDNCAIEVYTCEHFIELETLSPMVTLNPGEELAHTEEWILSKDIINPENGDAIRKLL